MGTFSNRRGGFPPVVCQTATQLQPNTDVELRGPYFSAVLGGTSRCQATRNHPECGRRGLTSSVTSSLHGGSRAVAAQLGDPRERYRRLRRQLGQAVLLGLEVLIVGDIIRTIIVDPTLMSVGVLGMIVAIRIVLSFSLEVEINRHVAVEPAALREPTRTRTPDTCCDRLCMLSGSEDLVRAASR